MRLALVTPVVVLLTFAIGGVAQAQSPVQVQVSSSAPRIEFGAHINFVDLWGDASRTRGGRFAKRHADWLVSELTYDKTSWKYESRATRLLIADLRLQSPTSRGGRRPFVSVGVARASGMSFEWSPVVSPGWQYETPGGTGVFRVELQLFSRGRTQPPAHATSTSTGTYDRARILLGVAIGIP